MATKRPPKSGFEIGVRPPLPGPLMLTEYLACFYCGGQVTYAKANIDHIVPRSRITHHELADCADNLVVACSPCNFSKGARTWDGWSSVLLDKVVFEDTASERELAVFARAQYISAVIDYRHLEHLGPHEDIE